MDAILLAMADFWWVAPVAAAGGVGAFMGVRNSRRSRARRLDVEASAVELKAAQEELREARNQVKATRGELAVAKAALPAQQASPAQVDGARRAVAAARARLKRANQIARGRRAQLQAARGAYRLMPKTDEALPLARTIAAHDAVLVAWVSYETDIDKALAYPAMSDPSKPATAAFFQALDRARWLRPSSAADVMSATTYSSYRTAVRELAMAFEAAERAARKASGKRDETPGAPRVTWSERDWMSPDTWNDVARNAREAAASASGAVADAYARVRAAADAARKGFTDPDDPDTPRRTP